jgi:uncharacterized membrane protein
VTGKPRLRRLRRRLREAVRDNQWLLPAIGAVTGWLLSLAIGTDGDTSSGWTITVDRSRETLLTSLGLVFTGLSIILALASVGAQNVVSRFGSRTLRIYGRHSADRWVIGAFAMAAAFILTEQFQLRTLDPEGPAPVAGITVSVVLLVLTGVMMIWYIGAVIRWFRVDRAVEAISKITREAARAVTRRRRRTVLTSLPMRPDDATDLLAPRSGHLAEVDTDKILEECRGHHTMVVITLKLGQPTVKNKPIGWVQGRDSTDALPPGRIREMIDIAGGRELRLSIDYGIWALVDIAIMALSPAVNDPNSAVQVIEELGFLLCDLEGTPLGPLASPDADTWPRVVINGRSFGELVEIATTQIVLYGISDPNVHTALSGLAANLDLLDLSEHDQRYVDAFAAKLDPPPPA